MADKYRRVTKKEEKNLPENEIRVRAENRRD